MTFFHILIFIKCVLLGAVYGRVDGGGIVRTHEWIERSLIMFFFVLACAPFAGLWALFAYLGVVGLATGHGQYFLGNETRAQAEDIRERVDFIVTWFFGVDPRELNKGDGSTLDLEQAVFEYGRRKLFWRNVFGMFVTGSLVGLPAVVISLFFSVYIGLLFLLTGVVKAFAYMISYKIWGSTEPAEYINGGLRNVLCLVVIYAFFDQIM